MNYKNYTIEPDNTGYTPKGMMFGIFKEEEYITAETKPMLQPVADLLVET